MNSYIWITSISGIALITMVLLKNKKLKKEFFHNNQTVLYMDPYIAKNFIENDMDGYVQSLSIYDLRARNATTISDYLQKSTQDIIPFNTVQQTQLNKAVEYANDFFKTYRNYYIDSLNIQKIPWIFILTNGYYENGLPHTRQEYIFLTPQVINTNLKDLIITLIHEKIHVYQRIYLFDIQKKLINMYYKKYGFRKNYENKLLRANPDLDQYIYVSPQNERMVSIYNSDHPKNISDATGSKYEHPFEEIAYTISKHFEKTI